MLEQMFNLSNYSYNPHAVPLALVSAAVFLIAIFIFIQAEKVLKNISFFCLCLCFAIWLLGMTFLYLANNPQTALLCYKCFAFFGVAIIMPAGFLFSVAASGFWKKQRFLVLAVFISAVTFYVLALTTDKFISTPRLYYWGYYPTYTPLNWIFIIFFSTVYIGIQANLWRNYKQEKVPIKKTQVLTIIIAFLFAFIGSVDFIAKFWDVALYPFGFIPIFIFTLLIAYSIVRYKAFDIETALHKTALWLLTFLFVLIPVFFLYKIILPYITGSDVLQFLFWAASLLIFTFYFRVVQPKIDHFFQRRKSNLEEILSKFVEDLVYLKGLDNLIQRIETTIADTLYPQQIDIFIYNEDKKKYTLSNALKRIPRVIDLKEDNKFLQWLARNGKIIYKEFIEIDPQYASIKEEAKDYFDLTEAIVAIPLVLNTKLLGMINLGKKANFQRYRASDFYFLNTLKNESVIAILNSLLYENMEEQVKQRSKELIEVQSQLIQAEKLATVGTLAGGVAHEINNPLAAILTNAQMLLDSDTINNESDKESLELIEEATKRCQNIVQKLMFYARKPLESKGVTAIDLLAVVNKVISFIGYQMEQENVTVRIQADDKVYSVMGNHNELEQVVTNILLNAKDAIRHVKKSGEIHISFSKSGQWIELKIKDEGGGISSNIQSKIFDPFFTTKDIGEGLGLGLSICQAIIQRHNGEIKVKSQSGEGAVFIIRLGHAIGKDQSRSQ